jgi:hypothetical protein
LKSNRNAADSPDVPDFDGVVDGGRDDEPRLARAELDVGHFAPMQPRPPHLLS